MGTAVGYDPRTRETTSNAALCCLYESRAGRLAAADGRRSGSAGAVGLRRPDQPRSPAAGAVMRFERELQRRGRLRRRARRQPGAARDRVTWELAASRPGPDCRPALQPIRSRSPTGAAWSTSPVRRPATAAAVGRYTDAKRTDHGVLFTEKNGHWSRGVRMRLPTNAVSLTTTQVGSHRRCGPRRDLLQLSRQLRGRRQLSEQRRGVGADARGRARRPMDARDRSADARRSAGRGPERGAAERHLQRLGHMHGGRRVRRPPPAINRACSSQAAAAVGRRHRRRRRRPTPTRIRTSSPHRSPVRARASAPLSARTSTRCRTRSVCC